MNIVEDRYLTPEQYLALEARSPLKHEYVAGEIYAMTGGTQRHNVISGNAYFALRQHLRGGPCQVFMGDVKLRVAGANAYYYPDVVVSCRESADPTKAGDSLFADDPVLVIEVLSPGTEAIDRREKLAAYRQLPSLKEYALVAQDRQRVEIYRRAGAIGWIYISYDPGDVVELAAVQLSFPIASLYAGTDVGA